MLKALLAPPYGSLLDLAGNTNVEDIDSQLILIAVDCHSADFAMNVRFLP